jgi:hypothetical protein
MIKDTIKTILKTFLTNAGIILVGSSIAYRFGINIKQKEVLFFVLLILIILSISEILTSNILSFVKKNNTDDIDERIIDMLKEIDLKQEEAYTLSYIIWYAIIASILIFVTIPNFIMLGLSIMLIINSVYILIILAIVHLFEGLIKKNTKFNKEEK